MSCYPKCSRLISKMFPKKFGEQVGTVKKCPQNDVSGTPFPVPGTIGPFQEHYSCSCYLGTFSRTLFPVPGTIGSFQEHAFMFLFPNIFQELGNMFPKFWGTCYAELIFCTIIILLRYLLHSAMLKSNNRNNSENSSSHSCKGEGKREKESNQKERR